MVKAITKGKQGERQAILYLQRIVNEEYDKLGLEPPLLKRNLEQVRSGGYDIEGLPWIALEVKRQETLHIKQWWEQTIRQSNVNTRAVLMFRRNREKWSFCLTGSLIVNEEIRISTFVIVDAISFDCWFREMIKSEIKKAQEAIVFQPLPPRLLKK